MRLVLVLACALALAPLPAAAKTYILAFGLWDAQNVFALEATRGAAALARELGPGAVTQVRINRKGAAAATPRAILDAIKQVGARMDPERDVLALMMTSHGSQAGIAVKIGDRVGALSPGVLGQMLREAGVKNRVLIISACYSGVFADALADSHTLVITAADANHPSFGCTNTARWTYFGEAFFAHALARPRPLPEAFAIARREIAAREASEGFDPSNPQFRGGEAVLPLLRTR